MTQHIKPKESECGQLDKNIWSLISSNPYGVQRMYTVTHLDRSRLQVDITVTQARRTGSLDIRSCTLAIALLF